MFVNLLAVRWTHFATLVQTLTIVHFKSRSVAMLVYLRDTGRPPPRVIQVHKYPSPAAHTFSPKCSVRTKILQLQELNPAHRPQIQLMPCFNIDLFIKMAIEKS